ncbi:hypothetical protein D9756_001011 [Leucocoprinus leucothites]|uniref:DUF6533 domain-containing protein n=1 Tax=Leucocoprinus leucothites TaxID=201217 RepID=A0A8H5GEH2_9AGAR|nr:hypothetical protein D9756_001011 [Leucoagaricus leucothites]
MDPATAQLAASHLLAGKYFQLAAFVMLVYDHILTFSQEKGIGYAGGEDLEAPILCGYPPLSFVTAFQDPHWIGEPYVLLFPYGWLLVQNDLKMPALRAFRRNDNTGQLVMILRVYAIYDRNVRILVLLLMLWAAQIVVSAYGLHTGYPAPLPKGLVGCILTGEGPLFPSVWISPLVTDSAIFFLTINRTKHYLHHLLSPFMSEAAARALMILVRDGTMYFFVIFLANLLNTLMFFLAPSDLKAIAASFSQLLTSTMISRLVLNLRSISTEKNTTTMSGNDHDIIFRNPSFVNRERTRLSVVSVGRRETTSLWTKALDSLADETLGACPTTGRGVVGIHVTREVVYGDVPMHRVDQPPKRRTSMKPSALV